MVDRELDVIIVSYNSAHVLPQLLDSLPAALDGLSAGVVVVDNGSVDGTVEVAVARGDCHVICAENLGYAAGINRGIRDAASSEVFLVLNPDVVLAPGSIRHMLTALEEPGVGVVLPRMLGPAGDLQFSLRREPTLLRALGLAGTGLAALSEHVSDVADYSAPRVVDWGVGAVMLMSRKCYVSVDGMDESFFLYSEETDFSLRARDLGFLTRYEPSAVVMHIGGQSGVSQATNAMKALNRVRLYRRRHGLVSSWCYYWLTVLSESSWLLRGARLSDSSVGALLRPSRRPEQLGCSRRLMPQ